MHRIWFVLLALSLGLNAGLLYERHVARERVSEGGGMPPGLEMDREGPGRHSPGRRWPSSPRHRGDPEEMARRHLERMSRELDLSEEQREQMDAIFRDSIQDLLAATEEVAQTRRALLDLFSAAEIDSQRVRELVAKLTEAHGRVESIVSGNMVREAALLTPEQRVRYIESLPWHHGRREREPPPQGP